MAIYYTIILQVWFRVLQNLSAYAERLGQNIKLHINTHLANYHLAIIRIGLVARTIRFHPNLIILLIRVSRGSIPRFGVSFFVE